MQGPLIYTLEHDLNWGTSRAGCDPDYKSHDSMNNGTGSGIPLPCMYTAAPKYYSDTSVDPAVPSTTLDRLSNAI